MEKKSLYVAYGSNLNLEQMKYRCPFAKLYSTGVVKGYELQFKGAPFYSYLTIGEKEGAELPVAVWEITPRDEKALDGYEGYPSHYFKKDIEVELKDGKTINAMAYIMDLKMQFGVPNESYYYIVSQGYEDCKLNIKFLKEALKNSIDNFYMQVASEMYEDMQKYVEKKNLGIEDVEPKNEETPDFDDDFIPGMGW